MVIQLIWLVIAFPLAGMLGQRTFGASAWDAAS